MSQYAHYSFRDEQLEKALKLLPPHVHVEGDVEATRQAIEQQALESLQTISPHLNEFNRPDESKYLIEDKYVPVTDSYIRIRIISPVSEDANATYSLLFWTHAGGYFTGIPEMDDERLAQAVIHFQLVVVSVDYRLAPEYPFPTGLDDSYEALKWCLTNAQALRVDSSKGVIVGGTSSGANFAAVIALRAREDQFFKDGGFSVTGQILQSPEVVHPKADLPDKYKDQLLSMTQNKDAPIVTQSDIFQLHEYYKAPPNDPDVSILLAPSHTGLPPAFFQISGYDPLRDEGILYEKVLRESGVKTKMEIYPGLPHGVNFLLPHLPVSKKWEKDFSEGLQWLLQLSRPSTNKCHPYTMGAVHKTLTQ
ncbi:AB hydrolase superfamily protein [Abortiporus biennis]